MKTFENSIQSALVIYCDYCGTPEIRARHWDDETEKEKLRTAFAMQLKKIGWIINIVGAVKCGPCGWREKKDGKAQ